VARPEELVVLLQSHCFEHLDAGDVVVATLQTAVVFQDQYIRLPASPDRANRSREYSYWRRLMVVVTRQPYSPAACRANAPQPVPISRTSSPGLTGIPTAEEQALRSRGEEYRRYQQTNRAFVPWFPKASLKAR